MRGGFGDGFVGRSEESLLIYLIVFLVIIFSLHLYFYLTEKKSFRIK